MPIIAERQFLWPKNNILMPFKTEVRGVQRTLSLLKHAHFPATLATCNFAPSRGVLHL